MADIFLFDTPVYISYIRGKEHPDLVERAVESGRVVLSSDVAMELYAGASLPPRSGCGSVRRARKKLSAYEIPREDDWAQGGVLVERFTRFRGHARVRDHFRDTLVVLAAVNRGALLVTPNAHFAGWANMLKRKGETLRLKIL